MRESILLNFKTIILFGFALSISVGAMHIVLENSISAIAYGLFGLSFSHILHALIMKD